jgi:penicillin-binding protein 1A
LENNLSLALGANLVTPLELTGVYASLAAGGRAVTPWAIKEIRNREGQVLYRRTAAHLPVTVNPDAVATLTGMMEEVVRSGTGRRAALDRPMAGKTGTSSDYRDAWFLGFTADYTTGVWLGNDDNEPMKKVTGGSLPAELWHDYMMEAEADLPPHELVAGQPVLNLALPQAVTEPIDELGQFIMGLFGADRRERRER